MALRKLEPASPGPGDLVGGRAGDEIGARGVCLQEAPQRSLQKTNKSQVDLEPSLCRSLPSAVCSGHEARGRDRVAPSKGTARAGGGVGSGAEAGQS